LPEVPGKHLWHHAYQRGEREPASRSLKELAMAPQTVAAMVSATKERIENLSVDGLVAELATGEVVLVDIREPDERTASGTIPGAVAAPRGMLEFFADPTSPYHRSEFEPDRRIVLFCASGGRSALATDTLLQLGYSHPAHLDGGLKDWMANNQPVASL
jgi:rhodanese-related sulfurtransferase